MAKEKLTKKQAKALSILRDKGPMSAMAFSQHYYENTENEHLLTAVSNQGNGACAGKKAWLCAGSYLGKLAKKGLVRSIYAGGHFNYEITEWGREVMKEI